MPFSLPRWVGLISQHSESQSNSTSHGRGVNRMTMPNFTECYVCSQMGVPVFHSTHCNSSNQQPHWEAMAGSSLNLVESKPRSFSGKLNPNQLSSSGQFELGFGSVLDPRSWYVMIWNRAVLLARALAVAVDPLFFYVVKSGSGSPCFHMDYVLAIVITVIRTCVDLVHLCHLLLQFKLAYLSSESLVIGCGRLVWGPRDIALHYLRSLRGFWFDAFVILPMPQVVIWFVIPKLLKEEKIKFIMTLLLVTYLFQSLPNFYHSICLMRRLRKVTGYIFGSVWWRFNLNVLAYLIASHVAGGLWYVLATHRLVTCVQQRCDQRKNCNLNLFCSERNNPNGQNMTNLDWYCLDVDGPFPYGIYNTALLVFASNSLADRILYPIYWGLLNLSSFGNELVPTSQPLEVIFSICISLGGLGLFVTLIGNIQICLRNVFESKRTMQLQSRDMERWMKHRQLPSHLRQRVRDFQRHKWGTMEGQDEMQLIKDLPDGLRRDIKRYLCLDLIKKVPLFLMLDDLILDNICDMLRPLVYSQGEKIIREGDPVKMMVFILNGRVKRSQGLRKGFVATSVLKQGCFFGDELLSWCLRQPFSKMLPSSAATFSSIEPIEGYGLEARDFKYITDHFRYKFGNPNVKRIARYYSSNWRTWGAVVIQLAWRRYRERVGRELSSNIQNEESDHLQLKRFVSMFLSLKPNDHLD